VTWNEFEGKKCEVCGSQANNLREKLATGRKEFWCDDHVPDDFGWWKKK
jgi:hypothetical protein